MPSITITTTAAQALRLITAVGDYQRLGRVATDVEVKAIIISYLTNLVLGYERKIAEDAAKASIVAPTPFVPT